jgi:hypothetical protein
MSAESNAGSTYELRGKLSGVFSNIIDNTLSIEGAGADAKATGDAIKETNADLETHAKDKNNPHGVTAEQVGARPNTWTPTALEVGARPNTWLPTIAEIGAAPSGYGLGYDAYHLTPVMDANTATLNGWYLLEKEAENGINHRAVMRVDAYSSTGLMQTVFSSHYSNKCPLIQQRSCVNGVWSYWEWLNPPMELGYIYDTTKWYQGKHVYVRCYDGPALPATANTPKNYGFLVTGQTSGTVLSVKVLLSNGCLLTSGYNKTRSASNASGIWVDNTNTSIRIVTDDDFSSLTPTFIVEYVVD